jgi:hypothetical protein
MAGLSFLAPLYLLGALAITVPILLHLFRRRTDTVVEFPAIRMILASPVEQQSRRRLREIILLALRVAALVLLAGAFARPYLAETGLAPGAGVTVVAVDTSYSLSAPGQHARARELATAAVNEAPPTDAVALVGFGDTAALIVEPTADRAAVAAAVAALQPRPTATRYAAALARAVEIIGDRPGRIVVVTDLQQAGWDGSAPPGVPDDIEIAVRHVPPPAGNLAVTSAERRESRVVAAVRNYGLAPRRASATLRVDDRVVGEVDVEIAAQALAEATFDRVAVTGTARVSVVDDEGYEFDNVRYAVLDPARATRVAIVVADPAGLRGGLYVERALSVADEGRRFAATVVDGRTLSGWAAADLAARQALVVLGTRTLDRRGRDLIASYVRAGGPVLLALGPDVDPGTLRDVLGAEPGVAPDAEAPAGATTLIVSDRRHPVFRPFVEPSSALGDVSIQRFRRLTDQDGRRVLARFSGGAPALTEQRLGDSRLLMFTSDLDNQWNRFPLSPAFVPFTVEAIGYLTEGRHMPASWTLPARPDGLDPAPGVFTIATKRQSGGGDGGDTVRVALNVDVRESDPSSISPEAFSQAVSRTSRSTTVETGAGVRAAEDEQRLWQIGLLLMLAALAGEGVIGRKPN